MKRFPIQCMSECGRPARWALHLGSCQHIPIPCFTCFRCMKKSIKRNRISASSCETAISITELIQWASHLGVTVTDDNPRTVDEFRTHIAALFDAYHRHIIGASDGHTETLFVEHPDYLLRMKRARDDVDRATRELGKCAERECKIMRITPDVRDAFVECRDHIDNIIHALEDTADLLQTRLLNEIMEQDREEYRRIHEHSVMADHDRNVAIKKITDIIVAPPPLLIPITPITVPLDSVNVHERVTQWVEQVPIVLSGEEEETDISDDSDAIRITGSYARMTIPTAGLLETI